MDTELYKSLCDKDLVAAEELIGACSLEDGVLYDACMDADFYYIIRNTEPEESGCDAALCALLCGFRLGETLNGQSVMEIQAFTHPALRRLGCFSMCFDSLRDDFRGFAFKFAVKEPASEGTAETLRALGAVHLEDEYFMKKTLSRGIADPGDSLCRKEGEVHFAPYNADTLYLYGLLVYDSFRGKGFGETIMRAAEAFTEGPYKSILLQVSGNNIPAYSLYKKLGYEVFEQISYYTTAQL